ncbi:SCAN domain-containing protein 3 [Oopsacas minuta]|uniref:SCAN domain-containing protein 3 n=1 Tax=Oopsacas minuta TaxID=111878 RepID=A0AAV7KBA0_9METZ|nr:SCAN domain-containing protein 3 [Oopsacas minuta]
MLFSKPLETDTKGEIIFMVIKQFCEEKNIPMGNTIACATDGAPSMIGRHRGFIAHLKRAVPKVFSIHCVIHRQHLIAKHLTPNLHQSLQIVIKATDKIKKNSLNDRIFQQLCENNDEDYKRLLLHTEVRWLSKGNCLKRFHQLFDLTVEFLEEYDSTLAEKVKMIRTDVAYFVDIFEKLNIVNKQLQGNNTTLIQAKGVVLSFLSKLTLFRQNIAHREFGQLLCLSELDMANNNIITDQHSYLLFTC